MRDLERLIGVAEVADRLGADGARCEGRLLWLLLVELCLQRIHSSLEVFLVLLLLLLTYRLSGGPIRLPRGLILRLQLGEHLIQRCGTQCHRIRSRTAPTERS
jgi:hypothetical protein